MAVYTQLSDESLLEILAHFSMAPVKQIQGIEKGSENSNYFVETAHEKYVLTIFEERAQHENIPFILDILNNLCEQNIICPRIVTAVSGQRRYTLESGKSCILQTCMDGDDISQPSVLQCYAAGKTLANLHNVASKLKVPDIENGMELSILKEMAESLQGQNLTAEQKQILKEIMTEVHFQENVEWSALPAGFIHGDYFKDNVLYIENFVSGVIDFWFACTDYFVYDLAIALNAWGFDKGEYSEDMFQAFLQGYTSRRPLTDEEKQALPTMLRLTALRFFLVRFYDHVMGKNPKIMANKPFQTWQKRLKYHLENKLEF